MRLSMRRAGIGLALLVAAPPTLGYDDPWSAETEAAAERAVAALGARRARSLVATTPDVAATTRAIVGLAPRTVAGRVLDLESAKRHLGARESELEVRVQLPADVLFDVDRDAIRPDAAEALAHLATVIRGYRGPVRLIGHTDADGSDAHNLDLSQRRADSVRAWLVARERIDAARLATEGRGEAEPVAPNDSAPNKQRNRRVDVVIRKD